MKSALTILLLFASASIAFGQISPEGLMTADVVRMKLRGPVKSIETFWVIPGEGGAAPTLQAEKFEQFNRAGWITAISASSTSKSGTKIFHNRRGVPILREGASDRTYSYVRDAKTRITEQIQTVQWGIPPDAKVKVIEKIVLEYDERDNVIKRTNYAPIFTGDNDPESIETFVYDAADRITAYEKIDRNGKVRSSVNRVYRSDGTLQKISGRLLDSDRVLTELFDERGRPLRSSDNQANQYAITSYDEAKSEVVQRVYEADLLILTVIQRQDQFGNRLGIRQEIPADIKQKMVEEITKRNPRDADAIDAMMEAYGTEGDIFTYEYDLKGNWTRRFEFPTRKVEVSATGVNADPKPIRTQIRKITYFE